VTFPRVMAAIYKDYRRYRATGKNEGSGLGVVLLTQGFWASFVYRISHAVYTQIRIPFVKVFLHIIFSLLQKLIEIITGIRLPPYSQIGEGLFVGHFGFIIVHPHARIGSNCNLSQGVTIGAVQQGSRKGVPILGNRVYVGPNAVIIGNIEIGNDAAIGAGAVVTKSVPPRAVVIGNPARIISYKGSFELVGYDGMESDPERMAALESVSTFDHHKQVGGSTDEDELAASFF
jgi:serine O-acetyltransferase